MVALVHSATHERVLSLPKQINDANLDLLITGDDGKRPQREINVICCVCFKPQMTFPSYTESIRPLSPSLLLNVVGGSMKPPV